MDFLQLIQKPHNVQYGSFMFSPFISYGNLYKSNHWIHWMEHLHTANSNSTATFLVDVFWGHCSATLAVLMFWAECTLAE
jgi:hypothetical protein